MEVIDHYNGIRVFSARRLAGGGRAYRQEYLNTLEKLPAVNRIFEWCAGPAFIGFSLLGAGHCNTLCIADINPENVEVCQRTIRENGLEGTVSVYLADCFDGIPETEKWDMVVGNPPHHLGDREEHKVKAGITHKGKKWIVSHDYKWETHRKFYIGLYKHLKEDGLSLIYENGVGSKPSDFIPMAKQGGLYAAYTTPTGRNPFYYFGTTHCQEVWDTRWSHGLS